jgi:hypothetical protein
MKRHWVFGGLAAGCAVVPADDGSSGPGSGQAGRESLAAVVAARPPPRLEGQEALVTALGSVEWAYLLNIDWSRVTPERLLADETLHRGMAALGLEATGERVEDMYLFLDDVVETLADCTGTTRCSSPACLVVVFEGLAGTQPATPSLAWPSPGQGDPAAWAEVVAAYASGMGSPNVCRAVEIHAADGGFTCHDPAWQSHAQGGCVP